MSQFNTLNQLIAALKSIATRHKQINSFGVGDAWEVGATNELVHPVLWVNPVTADMPKTENGYSSYTVDFNITLFDLVNKDETNENEVLSDTFGMIRDIVNEFNTHPDYIDSEFNIINDLSFESFTERYDEEVSGWEVTFSLESPNRRSFCSSPIDNIEGFSFTPEVCTVTDGENPLSPIILGLGDTYTCLVGTVQSGITYQRPQLSGQLTTYVFGDDGSHLTGGTYDYTPPAFPISYAQLDLSTATPFLTLKNNNTFTNTDRFTDTGGTQTYGNDLVICHITGLMYYRVLLVADTFDNQITAAIASTQGGHSDWRVTNLKELENILDGEESGRGNYVPFSIPASSANNLHTTTTTPDAPTGNFQYNPGSRGRIINGVKSTSIKAMLVRNHFN